MKLLAANVRLQYAKKLFRNFIEKLKLQQQEVHIREARIAQARSVADSKSSCPYNLKLKT